MFYVVDDVYILFSKIWRGGEIVPSLRARYKKFLYQSRGIVAWFEFANGHLHWDHAHRSLSSLVKTLD